MNNLDIQYQTLLKDILENSNKKQTRNGETISVFGRQIRHKMSEGFPLLTTKRMPFKTMVVELLWFLRGDTNIKFLVDNNCHIWNGDAYKRYLDNWYNELPRIGPCTQEEFINRIKTDDEFAKKWGDLGSIYGKQWRSWKGFSQGLFADFEDGIHDNEKKGIDQIQNLINELKTNPDSRRLMVNAWNVGELDQMILPPCHFSFQCYSYEKEGKRYLSLAWNQRSCDVGLGIPFNIASYGLLLEIIAKEVGMVPYELIGNLGDCHIYKNQIDGVKEQLTREPFDLPTLLGKDEYYYLMDTNISFSKKIEEFKPDFFKLENYKSHPVIKLPLSN
jgi:thymidylate synthase